MSRTAHFTKTNITIGAAILVVLTAPIIFWQTRASKPRTNPSSNAQTATQQLPTTYVSYQGEDGKNALELLKSHAQAVIKSSSLGDYVTAINGNDGGGTKYWLFYINGKESAEGAATYKTHTGERIEWKLQ